MQDRNRMTNSILNAEKNIIQQLRERVEGMKEEWNESGRFVDGVDQWGEEYTRHAKMDVDSRNLLLDNIIKLLDEVLGEK